MGMMIGTNSSYTRISLKNADGSSAGTISISKPSNKSSKKKRLPYNFKQISNAILMSKTSTAASRAVTKARGVVAMLQRKLKNGEYDEKEVENAIIHAKKMERIARKRMKHMKEEEKAKQSGSCSAEIEEMEEEETFDIEEMVGEQTSELSREKLEEMMRELQELMEESMEDLDDAMRIDDLTDEVLGFVQEDMDPEDIERLKKKHRADELREIVDADMKYLKALFDKLQKEKQSGSGGSGSSGDLSGVSLQLEGMEVPVQVTAAPVAAEGGSVDVSV